MAPGEVDPIPLSHARQHRSLAWGVVAVLASLIGVQGLAASGAIGAQVLMLLPADGPVAGVGDGLRRGYGLAMAEAKACGATPPSLELGWLPAGEDPRAFLRGRTLPMVVIAPPAVSSLPYGLLAEQLSIPVLLPLQRGSSLGRLPGQAGADRLWPVLPGRSQEADQLARALRDRSLGKTMVIHDGTSELAALADRFGESLNGAGGWVVGPTNGALAIPKPNTEAVELLQGDLTWYQPQTLVVMTSPGSPLARAVASATLPPGLTLAWPFPVTAPLRNPQLGVEPLSRGPGWDHFEQAFQRSYGFRPGLVEAAGYDTGQLIVLSARGGAPRPGGWQLDWLNPRAKPLGLCQALQARSRGSTLALQGAASRLDLAAATPPTGDMKLTPVQAKPEAVVP